MKISRKNLSILFLSTVLVLAMFAIAHYYLKSSKNFSASTAKSLDISQLMDATLPNFLDELQHVTLKGGVWQYDEGYVSISTWLDTEPSSYASGDLNGDGSGDIAAIFITNSGGTGSFNRLAVFLNQNGTPQYLAGASLGDRIKINKISIADGILSADIITQGPNDGLCCPTLREIIQYKLFGGSLVEIGKSMP